MDLPTILKSLCKQFDTEIDDFLQDSYCLKVNDEQKVNLERLSGKNELLMYAYLFPIQDLIYDKVCRKVLEENTFGKLTGSSVISISTEKNAFVLSQRFDLDYLTPEEFLYYLDQFTSACDILREMWEGWQQESVQKEVPQDLNP